MTKEYIYIYIDKGKETSLQKNHLPIIDTYPQMYGRLIF